MRTLAFLSNLIFHVVHSRHDAHDLMLLLSNMASMLRRASRPFGSGQLGTASLAGVKLVTSQDRVLILRRACSQRGVCTQLPQETTSASWQRRSL